MLIVISDERDEFQLWNSNYGADLHELFDVVSADHTAVLVDALSVATVEKVLSNTPECDVYTATVAPNGFWCGSQGETTPIWHGREVTADAVISNIGIEKVINAFADRFREDDVPPRDEIISDPALPDVLDDLGYWW